MGLLMLLVLTIFAHSVFSQETCLISGRFRSRDSTCKRYYLCARSRGSLVLMNYLCPEPAIFNPSTNRCSVNAQCIEDICKDLPISVTKIPDPNANDCKTYIECVGTERYPVVKSCEVGYFNKDLLPEPGCCLTKNC